MIFKKKFLILIIFFIIIIQVLLFTKNNQKTSFRYFKWTFQEVSIGKLINISFFSGLFISALLNNIVINNKKNTFEKIEENNVAIDNEDNINSKIEMPPLRDIRDTQPTISVNYRVVRNMEKNNLQSNQSYSDNGGTIDDWDNDDYEW